MNFRGENDGKIRFQVSSNIPEGTPLMFTLRGKKYTVQCKSVAGNGISTSEWFSDKGNPIKNGFYTIGVSCSIYNVLPEKKRKYLVNEIEIYMDNMLNLNQ
ncbi:MAG TPA: hypothetical protein H9735_02815 [Candidatus Anaerostipes excrementavium]|uniref:Uncharacterized protein n=1 Tax=Candidatus Anaerostipes excrementavium TaxID=2838463 RepID=A0A9D1WTM1_9FIRM|nr:hypothetical protein [uncultured Anaerostipes sp.]HIX67044.1 hypothetical protein [Candidatus Anaerostipes excrementavium]